MLILIFILSINTRPDKFDPKTTRFITDHMFSRPFTNQFRSELYCHTIFNQGIINTL